MSVSLPRYRLLLAVLLAVWWAALAIAPHYRRDWALENALVVVLVALLVATRRQLVFSRESYRLIFIFCRWISPCPPR